MTDKVSLSDMKQMLKVRENEIQNLVNENLEMQRYYDDAEDQVKSLYTCMVDKYHQMKAEHRECEKKLRLINSENAHFQYVTQCLEKTVEELIGRLEKNEFADDDALLMEECGDKLTKKLCEYRRRFKEISTRLDGVREKLAKSEESGIYLKKCADYLQESENRVRARRDRRELEGQSMVDQLRAELDEFKRVEERLRAVLSAQADEAELSERSIVTDKEKMRTEIEWLKVRLTSEAERRQRLDRYSGISRDCPSLYCGVVDVNRFPMGECRDKGDRWSRQDDKDRNSEDVTVDDGKSSSSSFFEDAVTCDQKSTEDRKPSSRSIANHSTASERNLQSTARSESSYHSWSDGQLMATVALEYPVSKPPLTEETGPDDRKSRCRSTVDAATDSDSCSQSIFTPDWQTVKLIRKYGSVKQPTGDDDNAAVGDDEPTSQSKALVSD